MDKITVNHYLNTNLKPYIIGNDKYYKLYFLLRYQNKNTKIKSLVNLELTESEYSKLITNEGDLMNKRIKNEVAFVENVIIAIDRAKLPFDIIVFNDFWYLATYPIIEKFQNYVRWQKERSYPQIKNIYEDSNFQELEKIIIELRNFVTDCPLLITDELFYNQLNDNTIKKEIENYLQGKGKIKLWEDKPTDKPYQWGDIIKIEYIENEYQIIDYIIENTIKRPYEVEFTAKIKGNIGDKMNYFRNILNTLSNT